MAVGIHGVVSNNVADVDAETKSLQVKLMSGEIPQRIAATNGDPFSLTDTGAMRTSAGAMTWFDQVEGATVNTNLWAPTSDTMVIDVSGGFIRLNVNTPSTAANKYACLQSVKWLPMYSVLEESGDLTALVTVQPQANVTMELGFGVAATNAAPTDGVFFRWNAQGQFVAVLNNNGVETVSASLTGTITDALGNSVLMPPSSNVNHLYHFEIVEDAAEFFVDDVLVVVVTAPVGQNYVTNVGHLPILARVYNGASTPSQAPGLLIGPSTVSQQDLAQGKDWGAILAGLGRCAYQSPTLFTQTANHANSANPGAASLSNTAAGYTTLGGKFSFATLAGAVTDFALFAYQVPNPYQLHVTSVTIAALNTGAAVGVTATIMDWSLGVNSSAVSLATADGAGTWAPRRIPMGTQSFLALAGIGAAANDITRSFYPPLIVDSGRFLHVILQLPIGLLTASQVIRGAVLVTGYFE